MTHETNAADPPTVMACPRDGTAMTPVGRRGGAYRCPTCRSMFLDVQRMRRGAAGRPPMWSPIVSSIVMSVVMTMLARAIARRLRHRSKEGAARSDA
jgi:hypothetical protein